MINKATRTELARDTAEKTGLYRYGLLPSEVDEAAEAIQKSRSDFICRIGKLTVHRIALREQPEVYCAYDSNISSIGFFIYKEKGREMAQYAIRRKFPCPQSNSNKQGLTP